MLASPTGSIEVVKTPVVNTSNNSQLSGNQAGGVGGIGGVGSILKK